MVYVTGDMHGDIERFKDKAIRRLRRNDTLIITGDFGFIWNGSEEERKILEWIGKRKFTTLFIEGTHDNLNLLSQYPVQRWNGGDVHVVSGRLMHLMRGQVYTIEDDRYFAMGGGESSDADTREPGVTWWPEEMPTMEEVEQARQTLAGLNFVPDYIISHECPTSIANCLVMDRRPRINLAVAFFDQMQQLCRYKKWFFGHYHMDKHIPPHYYALYHQVVPVRGKTR